MNTNFYATKDQSCRVRADRHRMDGERDGRALRAALHELQQRLGQSHNGPSVRQPVVKAGPAESKESPLRGKSFPSLRSIYTFFTSCGLL